MMGEKTGVDEATPLALYVDNNQVNQVLMQMIVDGRGDLRFAARRATDLYLLDIRALGPALILIDVEPDNVDGLSAVAQIRDDSELNAVPMIGICDEFDKGLTHRAINAGFHAIVNRPINIVELNNLLDRCLKDILIEV